MQEFDFLVILLGFGCIYFVTSLEHYYAHLLLRSFWLYNTLHEHSQKQ